MQIFKKGLMNSNSSLMSNNSFHSFLSNKSYRNALNRAIEKAKQNYYNNANLSHKNYSRKIWKANYELAKIKTRKGATLSKLVTDEGEILQEPKNIANIMNEYFANVGIKTANSIPMRNKEVKASRNNTSHNALVKCLFLTPRSDDEVFH